MPFEETVSELEESLRACEAITRWLTETESEWFLVEIPKHYKHLTSGGFPASCYTAAELEELLYVK